MGQCYGKSTTVASDISTHHRRQSKSNDAPPLPSADSTPSLVDSPKNDTHASNTAWPSPYALSSATPHHDDAQPLPKKPSSTPGSFFLKAFISPSPAKHIRSTMRKKRKARSRPLPEAEGAIPENAVAKGGEDPPLDKNFGYRKSFKGRYEVGKEVGRGHFGNTCLARAKKGGAKGQHVAVKIIPKAKMTTAISVEDVRREVKILKGLSGHPNLIKFYDAYEDSTNVYIVMELCEGGELLDRILSRGGRYTEEDAKSIVMQILTVVSFCHLQGVVHRDLKPENFLFATKEETSSLKLIDFGLSDFVRPDERLNDIVGSAYYVAPEVLHRSYSMEADVWSVGVITYILLCGSRPFWSRTESGIFRSVLRADPNLQDSPWPSVSVEGRDFVKRLLIKDYRKRLTASQALAHPWLREMQCLVPLDMLIFKLVRSYLHSTPFRQAALKALSKALTENELTYIRTQFELLEPGADGYVGLENFRKALYRNRSEAMLESRVPDILKALEPLTHRRMNFEEFCTAAVSPYQLEALDGWGKMVAAAYDHFEQEGNRVVTVQDLAKEMNLPPVAHTIIQGWIRHDDSKLSYLGYTKFLHGITIRKTSDTRHR